MDQVKQVSKSPDRNEPRLGFPGDAAKRRERIKRAIKANAETLRRLAQWGTVTVYPSLRDYAEVAAESLGTDADQILRLPRIALADSALASPRAGFGGEGSYRR